MRPPRVRVLPLVARCCTGTLLLDSVGTLLLDSVGTLLLVSVGTLLLDSVGTLLLEQSRDTVASLVVVVVVAVCAFVLVLLLPLVGVVVVVAPRPLRLPAPRRPSASCVAVVVTVWSSSWWSWWFLALLVLVLLVGGLRPAVALPSSFPRLSLAARCVAVVTVDVINAMTLNDHSCACVCACARARVRASFGALCSCPRSVARHSELCFVSSRRRRRCRRRRVRYSSTDLLSSLTLCVGCSWAASAHPHDVISTSLSLSSS